VYTYTYNNPIVRLAARQCNALAVNTQRWVAGGTSITNPLAYSLDGLTWLPSVNGTSTIPFSGGACNALAWNGSKWVAGGTGTNPIAYSYDGATWYQSANGGTIFSVNCSGLTWNGTYWLATGQGTTYTLAYSPDGINWTPISNSKSLLSYGYGISSRRAVNATGGGAGGGAGNNANTLALINSTVPALINSTVPALINSTVSTATLNQTLGYNQTWQNVTSVRGAGVPYLNDTGRPIMVMVYSNNSTGYNNGIYLYINSSLVYYVRYDYNSRPGANMIVPPNNTYRITFEATGSLATNGWWELR
jgi:hypothetical protein